MTTRTPRPATSNGRPRASVSSVVTSTCSRGAGWGRRGDSGATLLTGAPWKGSTPGSQLPASRACLRHAAVAGDAPTKRPSRVRSRQGGSPAASAPFRDLRPPEPAALAVSWAGSLSTPAWALALAADSEMVGGGCVGSRSGQLAPKRRAAPHLKGGVVLGHRPPDGDDVGALLRGECSPVAVDVVLQRKRDWAEGRRRDAGKEKLRAGLLEHEHASVHPALPMWRPAWRQAGCEIRDVRTGPRCILAGGSAAAWHPVLTGGVTMVSLLYSTFQDVPLVMCPAPPGRPA